MNIEWTATEDGWIILIVKRWRASRTFAGIRFVVRNKSTETDTKKRSYDAAITPPSTREEAGADGCREAENVHGS